MTERADNALAELKTISDSSTRIYDGLSSEKKAAFFQLVQHPVQATYVLANMWMSSGINNLRASQARISANTFADQVEDLFEQDFALETQYHQLLNGVYGFRMFSFSACLIIRIRKMGPYDGSNTRYVLLLAATNGEYVCCFRCIKATHCHPDHFHNVGCLL